MLEVVKIKAAYPIERANAPYRCSQCHEMILPDSPEPDNKMVRYGVTSSPYCLKCWDELIDRVLSIDVEFLVKKESNGKEPLPPPTSTNALPPKSPKKTTAERIIRDFNKLKRDEE